jgi:hypothetical protein
MNIKWRKKLESSNCVQGIQIIVCHFCYLYNINVYKMHNIDDFVVIPLPFLQIYASWWVNVFHYWAPPCNKI